VTNERSLDASILTLRFPDGEVEIRWTSNDLPVGVLVGVAVPCGVLAAVKNKP
jgi:hypothetical protein